MTKIIEITVKPDGQSIVQTKGFAGVSCRQASRFVEKALGTVQSDAPTPEMYQTQTNREQVSQKSG